MPMKRASGVRRFEAVLEKGENALGWTIARVPFDPATAWPKMVRLRVRGTVGSPKGRGFAFRTSLFPVAGGGFYVLVNRAMQRGGGVVLGSVAEFELEPDLETRPAELPDELAVLLDDEPGLREWYDALTEYMRREIGRWVVSVKSDEAKMRRAEQMAERLLSAMEAERELPPLIERALRARPKAKAGWEKMTETQRRGELLAVFYYQTPEARERRLAKLVEGAEKHAGK
jgi:Bacteriocin-protection, YdeI or OmpD-Associated/Domain of unknown function (DUF1905)